MIDGIYGDAEIKTLTLQYTVSQLSSPVETYRYLFRLSSKIVSPLS